MSDRSSHAWGCEHLWTNVTEVAQAMWDPATYGSVIFDRAGVGVTFFDGRHSAVTTLHVICGDRATTCAIARHHARPGQPVCAELLDLAGRIAQARLDGWQVRTRRWVAGAELLAPTGAKAVRLPVWQLSAWNLSRRLTRAGLPARTR